MLGRRLRSSRPLPVDHHREEVPPVLAALLTVAGLLGLAVGSFLNVVVHRVPAGLSVVRPASRCPKCGAPIRARHNVPVLGWLLLRGRCADCGTPISPRYPLVEAGTAVLFVLVALLCYLRSELPLLPALAYLAAIGVALALIDIDTHRLPNVIVLPSYPVLAVLLTGASVVSGDGGALARAGLGAAALLGFYLAITLVYPAGMGWGDVKLAGLLGGVLGYLGWAELLVGGFAGFLFGAVAGVVVIATGRGTRRSALPFGPFMILGAAAGITLGGWVGALYLGAVGV
jgi:leader peptidase (prepilin peptidase)/N-methyltransferase